MKRLFVYLALLAVAGVLGLINYYLLQLQKDKQEHIANLQAQVRLHLEENRFLNDRNDALRIEVDNLRSPDSYYSYEEKARENYGMIGENETFFVLPQEELNALPDIKGLEDEKSISILGSSVPFDRNMLPANVRRENQKRNHPAPIKLESLQ